MLEEAEVSLPVHFGNLILGRADDDFRVNAFFGEHQRRDEGDRRRDRRTVKVGKMIRRLIPLAFSRARFDATNDEENLSGCRVQQRNGEAVKVEDDSGKSRHCRLR